MKTLNELYNDLETHLPIFFVQNQDRTLRETKLDHSLIEGFKYYNNKTISISFKMNSKWNTTNGQKKLSEVKDKMYTTFKKLGYEVDTNLTILVKA